MKAKSLNSWWSSRLDTLPTSDANCLDWCCWRDQMSVWHANQYKVKKGFLYYGSTTLHWFCILLYITGVYCSCKRHNGFRIRIPYEWAVGRIRSRHNADKLWPSARDLTFIAKGFIHNFQIPCPRSEVADGWDLEKRIKSGFEWQSFFNNLLSVSGKWSIK